MKLKIALAIVGTALLVGGCAGTFNKVDSVKPAAAIKMNPAFTMGNGEKNWIVVDDVSLEGNTFTFSATTIQDDGWLVLHPFKDGKPNGRIYAGASFIRKGGNTKIAVSVAETPASGTPFLVMLHLDANKNGIFDFVFVDERNVVDRAVFEGSKMIAHTFQTP